jgi:transcriptional regulator with XRE-family HTH domain
LRALREAQGLDQADIEKRTGLVQRSVSRVECGQAVPSLSTLGNWARAPDLELHQSFFSGGRKTEGLHVTEVTRLNLRREN